jgi:hypothetical protein
LNVLSPSAPSESKNNIILTHRKMSITAFFPNLGSSLMHPFAPLESNYKLLEVVFSVKAVVTTITKTIPIAITEISKTVELTPRIDD